MKNKTIEIYRGHPIKQYNTIQFRISVETYKNIEPALKKEVSIRKIIEITSEPCACCKDTFANGFNRHNHPVKIKRGIIKKRR
jgi:hypothetical protein